MGAGSTYRCSRSVSCSSRPQPTRSRSRRLPHLDVDAYELALVWAYEKGQHTRGSTPPPAELLSKVTAIGHLPEHWREVVRIAQGIGQSCTRRSGTCQSSGQHQSYLHLRRHAQRWLPAVHPRRATGRFHKPTSPVASLSLDMEVDRAGWGSSPSAILATVSPQYLTYGTGEGDVRNCGARARTG